MCRLTLAVAVGMAGVGVGVGVEGGVGVGVDVGGVDVGGVVGVGVAVGANTLKNACAEGPPLVVRAIMVAVPAVCQPSSEGITTLTVNWPWVSAVAPADAKLGICVCPGASR
jgi:hypothetical protein